MAPLDAFLEVTGWTRPRAEAAAIVDAAGGDLALALSLYFDGAGGSPAVAAGVEPHGPPVPPPVVPPLPLQEELRREHVRDLFDAAHTAPRVAARTPEYALAGPLALPAALLNAVAGFVLRFAPAMPLAWMREPLESPVFATPYAEYNQAVDAAKRDFKHVLCVLYSDVHEYTPGAVAAELEAHGLLGRQDCVVWTGNARRSEPARVAAALRLKNLPAVVLLAPSPKSERANVVVVAKLLSAALPCADLGPRVDAAIAEHAPKLLALSLERQALDADRGLREEQNAAYERSLAADRQREHARAVHASWLARVFATHDACVQAQGSVRVSLRLPDGSRVDTRLEPDTPIRDVYDTAFAALNPGRRPDAPSPDVPAAERDAYAEYGFTLVSPLLRRPVPYSTDALRDEPAVYPSGVLMVDID